MLCYIAALALFDGHFRIEPRSYEIIIADVCREFLESLCTELRRRNISCKVYSSKRDLAYRLRVYGKEAVLLLHELARGLLTNPNRTLLAAAIDAEGNVKKYRNQPFRTRITLKNGEKLDSVKRALQKLGINYREYRACRARGQCDYTTIVISGTEENKLLYRNVKVLHPHKIEEVKSLIDSS